MKSLGITGNIGSGKSSVLSFLSNNRTSTYDLDKVAKEFYKTEEKIKQKVINSFPNAVSKGNQIDTNVLGKLVFNNPKNLNNLQNIVWPSLKNFILNKIKNNSSELIAFEGAIIIEANWHKIFDHIWIINSDLELSKERVINNRNLSENNFNKILKNQNNVKNMIKILEKDNIPFTLINNNSNLKSLNQKILEEYKNLILSDRKHI
ncbi:MAG: dephospho-CoA kinase [Dehalococcoidia bacterium]|nr:dephospho-CoA kinase [Dehalococcoidia bacterium]|tara:strand:- start:9966 stop:10583 length:618 start_codon:yes stop_codon:yes gene_type:complete